MQSTYKYSIYLFLYGDAWQEENGLGLNNLGFFRKNPLYAYFFTFFAIPINFLAYFNLLRLTQKN